MATRGRNIKPVVSGRGPLLRSDIIHAQEHSRSAAEAARFLNVSFDKYRYWAMYYNLYENLKNPSGKGIPRPQIKRAVTHLESVLRGDKPSYPLNQLKQRLILLKKLEEKCDLCGFETRRNHDQKMPLMLFRKNGNVNDWSLGNWQLRCFNCSFLTTGMHKSYQFYKDSDKGVNPADLTEDLMNFEETISVEEIQRIHSEAQEELNNKKEA